MARKLVSSIPEFVKAGREGSLIPNNFEDFLSHIHRPGGFWQILQRDKLTGDIQVEQWLENNWTDNGISVMFDAVLRASAPTQFTPANIMVIGASLNATTTTANIAAGGTVSSVAVAASAGNATKIPSGTALIINPGSNQLAVTSNADLLASGTTLNFASVTGPAAQINSGASVRYAYSAVPTADLSSASLGTPASYTSAMASGQFTKTITTGYGNRQIAVTNNSAYLFSTTGSPAATTGSYTEAWMSNANPVTTTSTVLRVVFDNILAINPTTNGQINITERL